MNYYNIIIEIITIIVINCFLEIIEHPICFLLHCLLACMLAHKNGEVS